MTSKIDVRRIIVDHVQTLKEHGSTSYSVGDAFLFLGLPFAAMCASIWQGLVFKSEFVSVIVTAFSVFAALLFNLLLLVYSFVQKPPTEHGESPLKIEFLKQIYANISFTIFLSILVIVIAIFLMFEVGGIRGNPAVPSPPATILPLLLSASVVFLLTLFVLTLTMILKRVHLLLSKEFDGGAPHGRKGAN